MTFNQQLEEEVKSKITDYLDELIAESQKMLFSIKGENSCFLCELDDMKALLGKIQSTASAYYLQSYLGQYTDKHAELSTAVQQLSSKRHGALIVVERSDSVEHLIQKGVTVSAAFTSSLIESIFYPGNPLHDGGMLVRGDSIVSAANILPLATLYAGEYKLGTRHRAAIGITEVSDALALVVSEETGKVSFAFGGNLYPLTTE
ncbi:diadenylate cyclase [Bacillus lacus]|uniref:Diadenylate cyclase n=1 Tax=Metabacillus lacus TaxID=1983721 RepID=A0A7X2M0J2_9BACI|nr:sporulation-specific diadenylate cyclase CdaS [Metabacillus lacus]MRX72919.1 diadenylate cyclase [Metabacillus lacus]